MKKFAHLLFGDKHIDSEKDDLLSGAIDQYRYLIIELSKLSSLILRRKVTYFFKFRKIYLLKLLALVAVIVIVAGFLAKAIFNIEPLRKTPKQELVLFVPDSIDTAIYIKQLPDVDLKFVVIYSESPTKTFDEFKIKLGEIESRNDYSACRDGSQYWGYYQFSKAKRDKYLNNISKEKFLSTPSIQEALLLLSIEDDLKELGNYVDRYDNKIIRGYHLTKSGLVAMSHNVGTGEVKKFLDSNCQYVPADGNGPATKFLILGGYQLN